MINIDQLAELSKFIRSFLIPKMRLKSYFIRIPPFLRYRRGVQPGPDRRRVALRRLQDCQPSHGRLLPLGRAQHPGSGLDLQSSRHPSSPFFNPDCGPAELERELLLFRGRRGVAHQGPNSIALPKITQKILPRILPNYRVGLVIVHLGWADLD